jgi:hypothetical protein
MTGKSREEAVFIFFLPAAGFNCSAVLTLVT